MITLTIDNTISEVRDTLNEFYSKFNHVNSDISFTNESVAFRVGFIENGTIKINNSAFVLDSSKISSSSIDGTKIMNGAINSDRIASNTILTRHFVDRSLTSNNVVDNSIESSKIIASSITNASIALSSISTDKIQSSSISASKLAAGSIATRNIVNSAVNNDHIISISTSALATPLIVDNSLLTRRIFSRPHLFKNPLEPGLTITTRNDALSSDSKSLYSAGAHGVLIISKQRQNDVSGQIVTKYHCALMAELPQGVSSPFLKANAFTNRVGSAIAVPSNAISNLVKNRTNVDSVFVNVTPDVEPFAISGTTTASNNPSDKVDILEFVINLKKPINLSKIGNYTVLTSGSSCETYLKSGPDRDTASESKIFTSANHSGNTATSFKIRTGIINPVIIPSSSGGLWDDFWNLGYLDYWISNRNVIGQVQHFAIAFSIFV